jgi:hypothetical protein
MAVAAGIIVCHMMAAGITDADITSKCAGFACHDGERRFFLDKGDIMPAGILLPESFKDLLDGAVRHYQTLPFCPEG